jgi:hypothetical protein
MHYGNLVIVKRERAEKETFDLEQAVEAAMGPHEENGGFWDWYQIGGRWTGTFDGYEPEKDPANIETCSLCAGTGTRPNGLKEFGQAWFDACHGCNGCDGTGKKATWPTQWKRHAGDVIPVSKLTEEHLKSFHRFVLPTGIYGGETYIPWETDIKKKFVKGKRPPLAWIQQEFKDDESVEYLAVVVDNHS